MVSANSSPIAQVMSSDYERLLEGQDSAQADPFIRPGREVLKQFGMDRGVSVFLTSELPPYTGVGAIAGCTAALVWAIARLKDVKLSREQAAGIADGAEGNRSYLPCGGGEVHAQALGGLSMAEIDEGGTFAIPIQTSEAVLSALQSRLLFFFTGRAQPDVHIVEEVCRSADRNRAGVIQRLHEIKAAAIELRQLLVDGNLDGIGACLDRTWQATRGLGPDLTDPWVDQWYEMARSAGAAGGKVNGLGGAGFLLLYCEPDRQGRVTEVLESAALRRIPISLEKKGLDLLLDESALPAATAGMA